MNTVANPWRKPLACVAALCVTLAGCGGGNSSGTASTGTADVKGYAGVIVERTPYVDGDNSASNEPIQFSQVGGMDLSSATGLPFFYGRDVYMISEASSVNGKPGPAVAF